MLREVVVGECNVVDFEIGIVLGDDELVELERDGRNNILAVVVRELHFRTFLEGHNVEVVRRQIDALMPSERCPLMADAVQVALLLEMAREAVLHTDYLQMD
jgi:hypothetical protein